MFRNKNSPDVKYPGYITEHPWNVVRFRAQIQYKWELGEYFRVSWYCLLHWVPGRKKKIATYWTHFRSPNLNKNKTKLTHPYTSGPFLVTSSENICVVSDFRNDSKLYSYQFHILTHVTLTCSTLPNLNEIMQLSFLEPFLKSVPRIDKLGLLTCASHSTPSPHILDLVCHLLQQTLNDTQIPKTGFF